MPEILNKKRKFIKRNFKQLSVEELAHNTGLTPTVVRLIIDEINGGMPGKDHAAHITNRAGFFYSWKTILLVSFILAVVGLIIYSPSLRGPFVFDDNHSIPDNPRIQITSISQVPDLIFSQEQDRKIGHLSFEDYYRALMGQSGVEENRFAERMGLIRQSLYIDGKVFKGDMKEGFIAFDPLDPRVKRAQLILKDFVLHYDANDWPDQLIDLTFPYDRQVQEETEEKTKE